ncbi:BQ5605_C002g01156 [Microbotryum silenes-dioicae]|uniref:BQ5605_C002g01156 protein n=1 Tax=Microbotryum silenes-dioicae TaxID=796604 RepID=A0A2X0LXV6_9BASI|nr:BQ5605_C002g01156 [Microbotryum silenes-dioicae]
MPFTKSRVDFGAHTQDISVSSAHPTDSDRQTPTTNASLKNDSHSLFNTPTAQDSDACADLVAKTELGQSAPKPKVSHARKTAPGHIKRPPNAFILFRSHCCSPPAPGEEDYDAPGTPTAQQLSVLGINDHRHISRIVSHLWKSLPVSHKKYWEIKAEKKKSEHLAAHPDYRYKPVYRTPGQVRKRRMVVDEADVEAEKRACEQVASDLLVSSGAHLLIEKEEEEEKRRIAQSLGSGGASSEDLKVHGAEEIQTGPTRQKRPAKPRSRPSGRRPKESSADDISLGEVNRQKWTFDTVMDAVNKGMVPPPPPARSPPKKPRNGPSAASQLPMQPEQSPNALHASGIQIGSYAQEEYPVQFLEIPRNSTKRNSGYSRLKATGGSTAPAEYEYLQGLNCFVVQSHSKAPLQSQQPQQAHRQTQTQSQQQQQHSPLRHVQQPHPTSAHGNAARRQEPTPPKRLNRGSLQLSSFSFPQFGLSPGGFARPFPSPPILSPRSMHFYQTFSSPTPSTRPETSSTRTEPQVMPSPSSAAFGGNGNPAVLPAGRRESELNLPLAGMRRRGTLGRTTQGGDVMLISPVLGQFGEARKFSLGRWELTRPTPDFNPPAHSPLAAEGLTAYNLPPEIAEMFGTSLPLDTLGTELDAIGCNQEERQTDQASSPSASDHSDYRPSSSSSEMSNGSDCEQFSPRFENPKDAPWNQWKQQSHIGDFGYHVEGQPFFVSPPSGLAVPQESPAMESRQTATVEVTSHQWQAYEAPQGLGQGPTFGSPSFGGSFHPGEYYQTPDTPIATTQWAHSKHDGTPSQFNYNATLSARGSRSHLLPYRERGSDATIRGRFDSLAAAEARRIALEVLQRQLQQPELQIQQPSTSDAAESGDEFYGEYLHLTPGQAKDAVLIDCLLRNGYGVSFDRLPESSTLMS